MLRLVQAILVDRSQGYAFIQYIINDQHCPVFEGCSRLKDPFDTAAEVWFDSDLALMAFRVSGMFKRVINLPATTMPPFMTQSNNGLRSANQNVNLFSYFVQSGFYFLFAEEQIGSGLNVLDFFKHSFG